MNDISLFVPSFDVEKSLLLIRECLESGWTGLGEKTHAFERDFKISSGHSCAHFLNSATSGIHLSLEIFKNKQGWDIGDEIITTPITFVATNHSILHAGLRPVFADVDEYMCMCPEAAEALIGKRTRAILFVGLGGNTGAWPSIVNLCRKYDLLLILDAAHMTGTKLNSNWPGLDSDAAIYSFQAVKNLPTADAGMLCMKDQDLDGEARMLSWMGIDKSTFTRLSDDNHYKWSYEVDRIGWKYHGNDIMASLALSGLQSLEDDNQRRRCIAAQYTELLEGSDHISIVPTASGCESSRHLYQVLVNKRDQVMAAMNRRRIFPGVHYRDNTEYSIYRQFHSPSSRASRESKRLLSLPLHLRLTDTDVERVADALLDAINELS